MLASGLAFLSYIPFEIVAKASLLLLVLLFIVDPFPPHSRLLALVSCGVVGFLARAHRNWQIQNSLEELQEEEHQNNSLSEGNNKKNK